MSLKDRVKTMIEKDREVRNSVVIPETVVNKVSTEMTAVFNNFMSAISGIKTWKDGTSNYSYTDIPRKQPHVLSAMFRRSGLAKTVVNEIVDDALRQPFNIDHEKAGNIIDLFNEMDGKNWLKRGCKTGRETGLGLIFCNVNDGQMSEYPVNLKRVKKVEFGYIMNRYQVEPMTEVSPGEYIRWQKGYSIDGYRMNGSKQVFHKSRVLRFDGEYCGEVNLNNNNGSHESLIDVNFEVIQALEIFQNSIFALLDNAIAEVVKVNGLQEMVQAKQTGQIIEMIKAQLLGKSVVNRVLMDKNDEYGYYSANLSGYEKIFEIVLVIVSLNLRMPLTKLTGRSPSASIGSQTGGYEEKLWNADVIDYQSDIKSEISKLLSWLKVLAGIPFSEALIWSFPELIILDEKTKMEIREIQNRIDTASVTAGILQPEEVAINRYAGEWTANTTIDIAARERSLAEKLKNPEKPQEESNTDEVQTV